VSFKNAIIIMTSNIGARFIQKRGSMGFQSPDAHETARSVTDTVMGEVRRTFNPELLNRIDEIIVFDALTDSDLRGHPATAGAAAERQHEGQADPRDPAAGSAGLADQRDLP